MVQQKSVTKICLQSLVVYEKGGVMHGTQHYRHKTGTVFLVTVISKTNKVDNISTMLKYRY